jgi:hypothetical protein
MKAASQALDWPATPDVTKPVQMTLEFAQAAVHALDVYRRRSLTRIERFRRTQPPATAALNINSEMRLLHTVVTLREVVIETFSPALEIH